MHFFALALLLRLLSRPEAIRHLEKIHASQIDGRRRDGVLLGYRLIVETVLYQQLEIIITCPEVLRLEVDPELARWWSDTEGNSTKTFNVGMGRGTPKSSYIANFLNDLLLQLVRCGNRWERFAEASKSVCSFAHTVELMGKDCGLSVLRVTDSESSVDIGRALQLCAAELLQRLRLRPEGFLNA